MLPLGSQAGTNILLSNNICIGNPGLSTDSATIRIGTPGTHAVTALSGVAVTLNDGTTTLNATAGVENLRELRGTVTQNVSPTIQAGTGFTVTDAGVGRVNVLFTTPFLTVPSVVATAVIAGGTPIVLHCQKHKYIVGRDRLLYTSRRSK
jgi:hypothetical protein